MLHAWRLRLRHPRTGEEMSFEAPPPPDFDQFWNRLK
jgi:23S rRNA pseudouridine1911/1915/1917 synthase